MFEEEGPPSLLIALDDGYLHAITPGASRTLRPGFPLAVGGRLSTTPLIADGRVYAASPAGRLAAWDIGDVAEMFWSSLHGGSQNLSFQATDAEPVQEGSGNDLIVDAETYNWPNPVRDGTTHLRIATREPCTVEIDVVDLAGNLVHSLGAQVAVAHVPVEFEWRPDVASGVYYARVAAEAANGRKDSKLYSIAVIR
jgi:hypothetical protein